MKRINWENKCYEDGRRKVFLEKNIKFSNSKNDPVILRNGLTDLLNQSDHFPKWSDHFDFCLCKTDVVLFWEKRSFFIFFYSYTFKC
jgi:hypothetical protein